MGRPADETASITESPCDECWQRIACERLKLVCRRYAVFAINARIDLSQPQEPSREQYRRLFKHA